MTRQNSGVGSSLHDKQDWMASQDCKEESGLHDRTRLDGRVNAFMTSQYWMEKSGLGDRCTEV